MAWERPNGKCHDMPSEFICVETMNQKTITWMVRESLGRFDCPLILLSMSKQCEILGFLGKETCDQLHLSEFLPLFYPLEWPFEGFFHILSTFRDTKSWVGGTLSTLVAHLGICKLKFAICFECSLDQPGQPENHIADIRHGYISNDIMAHLSISWTPRRKEQQKMISNKGTFYILFYQRLKMIAVNISVFETGNSLPVSQQSNST